MLHGLPANSQLDNLNYYLQQYSRFTFNGANGFLFVFREHDYIQSKMFGLAISLNGGCFYSPFLFYSVWSPSCKSAA